MLEVPWQSRRVRACVGGVYDNSGMFFLSYYPSEQSKSLDEREYLVIITE